jgi:hypothetical protein
VRKAVAKKEDGRKTRWQKARMVAKHNSMPLNGQTPSTSAHEIEAVLMELQSVLRQIREAGEQRQRDEIAPLPVVVAHQWYRFTRAFFGQGV